MCYQPAGYISNGNSDSRIRSIISKAGPNYRFPAHTDFKTCQEAIAGALNDYFTRRYKRKHVEPNALNNWKLNIFQIIDELFYSNNIYLLPHQTQILFSAFDTRNPRIS